MNCKVFSVYVFIFMFTSKNSTCSFTFHFISPTKLLSNCFPLHNTIPLNTNYRAAYLTTERDTERANDRIKTMHSFKRKLWTYNQLSIHSYRFIALYFNLSLLAQHFLSLQFKDFSFLFYYIISAIRPQ